MVLKDTPTDSPLPTRPPTPKAEESSSVDKKGRKQGLQKGVNDRHLSDKLTATFDEDIEPDELIPGYIEARSILLEYERFKNIDINEASDKSTKELEIAKLEAKLRKIEADPLFDKFLAEEQWRAKRIILERQIAIEKKQSTGGQAKEPSTEIPREALEQDGEVNEEAALIAAEVLGELDDEDDGIEGLFASLPQTEADPETGQMRTVVNSPNGSKIVLEDFGKWSGVSPRRVLEEACRSR